MDTKEFDWECVYWIDLAHDVGYVGGRYGRFNEPLGSIKFGWISWLAEQLLAYQEDLCSVVLRQVNEF
jgi:hypothetical protein